MLTKTALITAAAASALIALPTAAQAQSYGYYDNNRYERPYRGDRSYQTDRYGRTYDRYGRQIASRGDYYDRNYDNRYYGDRRCSGTTGTIVGGVAGALLGREITRGGGRYGGNSGTTGAIIGGALGALAGRAVDKGNC